MTRARGLALVLLRSALALAMPGACATGLSACDREVFDHASGASDAGPAGDARDAGDAGDAGDARDAAASIDCETAAPGTRCDDDNVCTTASTCRDQQCLAGSSSRTCTIADALDGVRDEQGDDGWFNGFWNADADDDGFYDPDTDFMPMEYCDDGNWRRPGQCGVADEDPDRRWTSNLSFALQHPETDPDLELPVRRWISPVSGPVRITVLHHVDGTFGDGTRAILLLDGDELWSNDAVAGDTEGTEMSFDVTLRVGTMIEQLVHPIGTSADDTTYFGMVIEGR